MAEPCCYGCCTALHQMCPPITPSLEDSARFLKNSTCNFGSYFPGGHGYQRVRMSTRSGEQAGRIVKLKGLKIQLHLQSPQPPAPAFINEGARIHSPNTQSKPWNSSESAPAAFPSGARVAFASLMSARAVNLMRCGSPEKMFPTRFLSGTSPNLASGARVWRLDLSQTLVFSFSGLEYLVSPFSRQRFYP